MRAIVKLNKTVLAYVYDMVKISMEEEKKTHDKTRKCENVEICAQNNKNEKNV